MTSRKRISLTVQIDVDSEEDREEALHSTTALIHDVLREKPGMVRLASHGHADFIPTDEQLRAIGVGGGSREF